MTILFQYEHHKIYLKSVLFSVSEKETNFLITPRKIMQLSILAQAINLNPLKEQESM